MKKIGLICLCFCGLLLFITACGQSGKLYLPAKPTASDPTPVEASMLK